jgi:tetratricopeptide (TPR) repeat protein
MRLIIGIVAAVVLPGQSPSAFDTHLNAGQAALRQSRYAEAGDQLRLALGDAAADPNRSPMRVVEAYSALCDLDLLMNRHDEAIAMASNAVQTLETRIQQLQRTGSNAANGVIPDLSPHLARLAGAYRAAGQTILAVPVLERALSIDRELGEDDPRVSDDYDKLGSAYMELKRNDDARAAYRHALDTRVSHLGPDRIEVATSWVNLGVLEERAESPKDAQADFEKALAISEKSLGPESYGLTGILDRLGRLFSSQKMYSDAEPAFQRSLAIREKVLGARHSDVAPALENLAMAYFFDSKYIEAEPLFQRSLQIMDGNPGSDKSSRCAGARQSGFALCRSETVRRGGAILPQRADDSRDPRHREPVEPGVTVRGPKGLEARRRLLSARDSAGRKGTRRRSPGNRRDAGRVCCDVARRGPAGGREKDGSAREIVEGQAGRAKAACRGSGGRENRDASRKKVNIQVLP